MAAVWAEAHTLQAEGRGLEACSRGAEFRAAGVRAYRFPAFPNQVSQVKNEKRTLYVYET